MRSQVEINPLVRVVALSLCTSEHPPRADACYTRHMTIQSGALIALLQSFPEDSIVRGFGDGITISNADGTGEVEMLNDHPFDRITAAVDRLLAS